jgi:hypothetical protein
MIHWMRLGYRSVVCILNFKNRPIIEHSIFADRCCRITSNTLVQEFIDEDSDSGVLALNLPSPHSFLIHVD